MSQPEPDGAADLVAHPDRDVPGRVAHPDRDPADSVAHPDRDPADLAVYPDRDADPFLLGSATVDEAEPGGPGGPDPDERVNGPAGDDRPRPGRSRITKAVVGGVALAGVSAAGVLGVGALRVVNQRDATLTPPPQIAGLSLDRSAEAAEAADYLRTALATGVDLDTTVGAVYAEGAANDRNVFFLGGTALLLRPERDLDTVFNLLTDDTGRVEGVHTVPPGTLGGVAQCGTVPGPPDQALSICGWADHGSIALAMFPGRSTNESATLLLTLREAIEQRT